MEPLIIISLLSLLVFVLWVMHLKRKAKEHDRILRVIKSADDYEKKAKQKVDELEKIRIRQLGKKEAELVKLASTWEAEAQQRLEESRSKLLADIESRNRQIVEREVALEKLTEEKFIGFPWLAAAYGDFMALQDEQAANRLENKAHPAYKAAAEVREAKKRRREAEVRAKVAEYQLKYYESLFPWIEDLRSEDTQGAVVGLCGNEAIEDEDIDPAQRWLSEEEFASLKGSERLQRALDSYWKRNKTRWQIGRDYERFVGWIYEQEGFRVAYHGIIAGFDDLGRDLIARKGTDVRIVQCKCWSAAKTIHEKHIFQLYGTITAYAVDNPKDNVSGHFMTSTKLSERAKQFATHLGIAITELQPLQKYPCIKCNVSQQTKEKIYHLPFDQQYDKTAIDISKGEFFAATIAEAEEKGFRRAFKYRGR